MRRREQPLPSGLPARLAGFRPEEWPADDAHAAYCLWSDALDEWATQHPEAEEALDAIRWDVVIPDEPFSIEDV